MSAGSVAASTGLVRAMDSLGRPALLGTATATDSTPVARSSAEYAYSIPGSGNRERSCSTVNVVASCPAAMAAAVHLLQLFLGR